MNLLGICVRPEKRLALWCTYFDMWSFSRSNLQRKLVHALWLVGKHAHFSFHVVILLLRCWVILCIFCNLIIFSFTNKYILFKFFLIHNTNIYIYIYIYMTLHEQESFCKLRKIKEDTEQFKAMAKNVNGKGDHVRVQRGCCSF